MRSSYSSAAMPTFKPHLSKIETILNDEVFTNPESKTVLEGVAVLSPVLAQLNPPPADSQAWLLGQIQAQTIGKSQGQRLLNCGTGSEDLVGKKSIIMMNQR